MTNRRNRRGRGCMSDAGDWNSRPEERRRGYCGLLLTMARTENGRLEVSLRVSVRERAFWALLTGIAALLNWQRLTDLLNILNGVWNG
jgi:hypothetical protein